MLNRSIASSIYPFFKLHFSSFLHTYPAYYHTYYIWSTESLTLPNYNLVPTGYFPPAHQPVSGNYCYTANYYEIKSFIPNIIEPGHTCIFVPTLFFWWLHSIADSMILFTFINHLWYLQPFHWLVIVHAAVVRTFGVQHVWAWAWQTRACQPFPSHHSADKKASEINQTGRVTLAALISPALEISALKSHWVSI